MTMLEKAWNGGIKRGIKLSLIASRKLVLWEKSGKVLDDEDDPFAGLDEIDDNTVQTLEANLAVLKEKSGDQIDADITSDEYIDFDIEVITSYEKLTNQEILAEINDNVNEESDGEEEDPNDFEPINKPGIEDEERLCKFLKILIFSQNLDVKVIKRIKS